MSDELIKPKPDLPALVASAAKYGGSTITEATKKSHAREFAKFERWCQDYSFPSLPTTPETLGLYLCALADGNVRTIWESRWGEKKVQQRPLKASTIEHAMICIVQVQKQHGVDWPMAHPGIGKIMKGIRIKLGTKRKKAAPLEIGDLKKCIAALKDNRFDDLVACRNRCILALGFWGAFRRSEIVALAVTDIEFVAQGLVVHVRRSKEDQEGAGEEVAIPFAKDAAVCAVRLTQDWLNRSELKTGPLFRRIDPRSGAIGDRPMWSDVVGALVKEVADKTGLDPDRFSAHSLRAGFMTTAAAKGKTLHNIMRQSRHKDQRVAMSYIRHGSLFTANAAEGLDEEPEGEK